MPAGKKARSLEVVSVEYTERNKDGAQAEKWARRARAYNSWPDYAAGQLKSSAGIRYR